MPAAKKTKAILKISTIRLDFQPRENLLEDIVEEYVSRIRRGDIIPPIRVRFDGSNYFCEDGFHRLEATRRIGLKTIAAEVFPGTLAEMEARWQKYLKRLHKELKSPGKSEVISILILYFSSVISFDK